MMKTMKLGTALSIFLVSTLACKTGHAVDRDRLHWVGVANIKYNSTFSREYASQIVSLRPSSQDVDGWYIEIGKATCADAAAKCDASAGVGRKGGNIKGGVSSFFTTLKTKFSIGSYYFEGSASSLDSAISGRIYERATDLLAGYFVLDARHDGADSFGFVVPPADETCFFDPKPVETRCFGSGAP
jgi:hypothetical protein